MGEQPTPALGAPVPLGRESDRRQVGRPKGPNRIPRTVHLLEEHDRLLAEEVEHQGLSQQYLIERALDEYFQRLARQRRRNAAKTRRRFAPRKRDGCDEYGCKSTHRLR